MKSFNATLMISASAIALLGNVGLLPAPAQALTITGNLTGFMSSGDIGDGLTIATGATVSPDGVVIDGADAIAGDLTNNGTVEVSVVDDAANTFLFGAIKASGPISGALVNTGTADASETAKTTASDCVNSNSAVTLDTPIFAAADTAGIYASAVAGNFSNTGDISGESASDNGYDAAVTTTGDASVGAGSRSLSDAWGAYVPSLAGDFSNAKDATISATANAGSEASIKATGLDVNAGFGELNSSANAAGVQLESDFSGPLGKFTNDGSISATATSGITADVVVSATGGTAEAEWADYYQPSSGVGVFIANDAASFTNTGDIVASTQSTLSADVEATGNDALIEQTSYYGDAVVSDSAGVQLATVEGAFVNGGKIESSAAANAAVALITTASGTDGYAHVDLEGSAIESLAVGISMDGDPASSEFTNTGSVDASASASFNQTTKVTSADGQAGYFNPASLVGAAANGITANYLKDFTNNGEISAKASLDGQFDLALDGGSSAVATTTGGDYLSAFGVVIAGVVVGDFTNTGDVSASGAITRSVKIAAEGGGDAANITESYNISSIVAGIEGSEFIGGLTNSKSISADSNVDVAIDLKATGAQNSDIRLSNVVGSAAYGVQFVPNSDGTYGDIDNNGAIKAASSADVAINAAVVANGDPGEIFMHNEVTVIAEGLMEGASIADKGTPHGLTNGGTISADGNLKVAVSEGSDELSFAKLASFGAFLSGPLNDIENSGTISAAGHLDVQSAPGLTSNASVVGLWVSTPAGDTVISNTGSISASLDGTGTADTTVAAMEVGFFVSLRNTPIDPDAVATITNSGTILATNKFGESYGINAATTPVPLVINQQGGSISGSTAIELVNGYADTLNWTGGAIHGIVDADGTDVVNVFSGTGTPANKTVVATEDFALQGGAALNVGTEDAPVTFVMQGSVAGTGEVNVGKASDLVVSPVGTIAADAFNMDPAATLTIQFTPTQAGHIATTGDANIDGTFVAQALPGLYGDKGSHKVIEAAGAVKGTFDNVSIVGDTLLLDFSATVHDQDVTVSWQRNAFDSVAGLSDNSKSVGGALEAGYDPTRPASKNTPELNDQISGLFTLTDPALYDRVLNSWSGSEYAQMMHASVNLSEPYLMALSEHLNDNRWGFKEQRVVMLQPKGSSYALTPSSSSAAGSSAEDARGSFWARGFGRWADTNGDANADGFKEDTYGAVLGFDYRVAPTFLVGIVGSYISDDVKFDDGDKGQIDRWSIGGYLSGTWDAFYLDGSFSYASDNYKLNRTLITGGTGCLAYNCVVGASAKYKGDGWIAHGEAGYNWMIGETARLQPFIGLNFTDTDTSPFTETGGGDLGLNVLDGTGKSFQSRVGARLSGEWGSGDVKWVPELRAEWRHEFEDNPAWIQASLVGLPNDPFTTVGSHVSRDLAVIGAGISAQFTGGWGLYLDYQGAFASGYTSHVAQGGVRVRF